MNHGVDWRRVEIFEMWELNFIKVEIMRVDKGLPFKVINSVLVIGFTITDETSFCCSNVDFTMLLSPFLRNVYVDNTSERM